MTADRVEWKRNVTHIYFVLTPHQMSLFIIFYARLTFAVFE